MKNVLLSIAIFSSMFTFALNPIAVNDTFYVDYEGARWISQSFIVANDANSIRIDTISYTGIGTVTVSGNSSTVEGLLNIRYTAPSGLLVMDSIQYFLGDLGAGVFDTAYIYFVGKRKGFEVLDLNNINATIDKSVLFSNPIAGFPGFEAPKGSGSYSIFASNLWIAGKNLDSVYSFARTFGYGGPCSGPIMDSVYYNRVYDEKWDRVWKVTKVDIQNHMNNWYKGGYVVPDVFIDWPAHGDISKGQSFNLAPFFDNNGDNNYDPYDGDYPLIKGQQAIYFIYNDERNPKNSNVMRMEVHGMAYAYDCIVDSALNNTIFVDYTIYNRSTRVYDTTSVGFWADFDIGGGSDDYTGCDVDRNTFYAYNGDGDDLDTGPVVGYGVLTPAQGITFLKGVKQDNDGLDNAFGIGAGESINGTGFGDGILDNEYLGMERFTYYNIGGGLQGDPATKEDYFGYLTGKWKDGTPVTYGGTGYGVGTPAKYMFPDTSDSFSYGTGGISQPSWTEATAGNSPGDKRGVGVSGPFTFNPGDSVEITLAFVFGRDYTSSDGITVMLERVDSIRSYYADSFISTCGGTISSINEKLKKNTSLITYPNPVTNELTIKMNPLSENGQLTIYDLLGKTIYSVGLNKGERIHKLSTESYQKGLYLVNVTTTTTSLMSKIVKE